jgi:hypothetical protein
VRKFLAIITLLCLFTVQSTWADEQTTETGKEWQKSDVVGLTMELVDPVAIQEMHFTKDGYVALTIGEKNGPHVALAAPLAQWRLTDGRLHIFDGMHINYELTLVSRDSEIIVVRDKSGKEQKYKIINKE